METSENFKSFLEAQSKLKEIINKASPKYQYLKSQFSSLAENEKKSELFIDSIRNLQTTNEHYERKIRDLEETIACMQQEVLN